MEKTKKQLADVIDLKALLKKVLARKRLFFIVWIITFVVACIYIVAIPRYYTSDVRLAPEMSSSMSGGTLGSIASAFGFDLGDMQTTDAITPLLYPDLMEDDGFVASLFDIQVVSQDGEINTTYYDYLKNHQKKSIWSYPLIWIKSLFPSDDQPRSQNGSDSEFNPYHMSKADCMIAEIIRSNIQFSVDKKTGVISIDTKAQDPLICKTLADSVSVRLQQFITQYRTNKARFDYEYYKDLSEKAKEEYENVQHQYARMADANINVSLRSMELKLEEMENEMLKYTTYTTINTQLEAAKAKVQERTPAFTLLKGASVPIKAAGPKRMIFVIGMLLFVTIITTVYVLKGELWNF